jgi:hypothetical protein
MPDRLDGSRAMLQSIRRSNGVKTRNSLISESSGRNGSHDFTLLHARGNAGGSRIGVSTRDEAGRLHPSMVNRLIEVSLRHRLMVVLLYAALGAWGWWAFERVDWFQVR